MLDTSALRLLQSQHRGAFLATLIWEIGLAGRSNYVGAGATVEVSQAQLECLNELQVVVAAQLQTTVAAEPNAYPDEAFLKVLAEKSATRGCAQTWESALARASNRARLTHHGPGNIPGR